MNPAYARKLGLRVFALALLALGSISLLPATASADDWKGWGHGINTDEACVMQYGDGSAQDVLIASDVRNFLNPYTWYCKRLTSSQSSNWSTGLPSGVSRSTGQATYEPLGGLDLQAWCSAKYPGSRAELANVVPVTVWAWLCREK